MLPLLAALFFASGAAGLIYQVLWLRLLALVFGVTVHAASTVLAAFMGGLALGSVLAGRLADRVGRPLRWFAAAEAGVALSALATPVALRALEQAYVPLHAALADLPGAITLARIVLASAVLLVPTTLMGATLPLVLRAGAPRAGWVGPRLGVLYGVNTAGAVAGAWLAGYVLIGRAGIAATFRAAAALNLTAALGAALLARRVEAADRSTPPRPAPDHGALVKRAAATPAAGAARRVLLVLALSGFASLALEVIWFRVLVLFFPATTYAFTTMLALVLLGLAVGSSVVAAPLRRGRPWGMVLAVLEVAIGVAAALSLAALAASYRAGWRTTTAVQASAVAILPVTLLMGAAFPIAAALWTGAGSPHHTGRGVGLAYGLNVCGGIAGAIAAGFLLLPWLGSARSVTLVAALYVFAGLLLVDQVPRRRGAFALAAIALFAGAAALVPDPFAAVLLRRYPGERLLWRQEGVQTTVSVHLRPMGHRTLYLDGLHQANDSAEMVRVHSLIGHLPMALHPAPRRALVIGLGGGATAGAVSRHDGVTVDLVELSREVVAAAPLFAHINEGVLGRANVRLRVDDGRNFLLVTRSRYDVITADIIQPYHAGAGHLYSVEYFRLARRRLANGGLMLQWIGHQSATQYKLIMRTFLAAFPEATLWAGGTLLVGTTEPLRIRRAAFEAKLRHDETRRALAWVGLASFDALLGLYTAGPEEMRRFVGPGPILTDDRPLVEYFLSLPRHDPPVDLGALGGDVRRLLIDE
jgi:spermidine synthase